MGLDHLDTLQGHNRLQYLLGHLHCEYHTRQLMMWMLIEYTQLGFGTMDNVLEHHYQRFHDIIVDKNWITEIIRRHLHHS
jgi:hypothetical protein